jgi:bifunctional non-homologous end joining protein LigD
MKRGRRDPTADAQTAPPVAGARRGPPPRLEEPELPTLVATPPDGEAWFNEVKYDGYRLFAVKARERVQLITRNGLDWTARAPAVARAIADSRPETAVFDGELAALGEDGISSFHELQRAISGKSDRPLVFYVFDLLYLDGWDLTECRLDDRKAELAKLPMWKDPLRTSDHRVGRAAEMFREACKRGLEGIVCKWRDAPYRPGRTRDWLKVKCQGREEFVVLGWTEPAGHRSGLGALHVGFYDSRGRLHYAGGVGTGFSEDELAALRRIVDRLATSEPPPFVYAGAAPRRGVHWVRPELVIEVRYDGWSGFGRLRHSVFVGRREDKPAADVVREVPDRSEAYGPSSA